MAKLKPSDSQEGEGSELASKDRQGIDPAGFSYLDLPPELLTRDQLIDRLCQKLGVSFHSDVYQVSDTFLCFLDERQVVGDILDYLGPDCPFFIDEGRQGTFDFNVTELEHDGDYMIVSGEILIMLEGGYRLMMPYSTRIVQASISDMNYDVIIQRDRTHILDMIDVITGKITETVTDLDLGGLEVLEQEMTPAEAKIELEKIAIGPLSAETLKGMTGFQIGLYRWICDGEISIPMVTIAGRDIEVSRSGGQGLIFCDLMSMVDSIAERLELEGSLVFLFPGTTFFATWLTKSQCILDYRTWLRIMKECMYVLLRERGFNVEIYVTNLGSNSEEGMPSDYGFEVKVVEPDEQD